MRPRLWVVCRRFGVYSEVWLWRQAMAFRQLQPEIVCWRQEKGIMPSSLPVRTLPFEPLPENSGQRWVGRLRNLGHGNFYGALGAEAGALRGALRESQPAVILCHFGQIALRVLPVARRSGVPVVAHFHGSDLSVTLRNRWYRSSLRRHVRHFAATVVVAEYQRQELLRLGAPAERIHLIPCGGPVTEVRVSQNVGSSPCRFLSVGRLIEKKAPLATIRAFARCCEAVPDAKLTIVGDGSLRRAAEALCRELGIEAKVTFSGRQPPTTVLEELEKASVFVQHSVQAANGDMEGWPVSIAEAMAAGLPIVSTRHADIPAQVTEGKTGFLVEENDWEDMGRQMILLAQNADLRREMGQQAAKVAREQFDYRALTKKLEELLLSVANLPGSLVDAEGQDPIAGVR